MRSGPNSCPWSSRRPGGSAPSRTAADPIPGWGVGAPTPSLRRRWRWRPKRSWDQDIRRADRHRRQLRDDVVDVGDLRQEAPQVGDPGMREGDHAVLALLERPEDADIARMSALDERRIHPGPGGR